MTLDRPNTTLAYSDLTDQALRVRAVEAAATYDTDALVLVTLAYMQTGSRRADRVSRHTLAAYAIGVRNWVPWAQDNGVQLLHPGKRDAGRYVAHLQRRTNNARGRTGKLSAATIAQYLAGARALYRALDWAGATDAQPFIHTSAPPDPTPGIVKNPPYQQEIEPVLQECEPRLAALLLLCAHTGLRASEALAVRTSDIDGHRLKVHGKGGRRRIVPLGRRVREALADLPPVTSDGSLFPWTYSQAAHRMRDAFAQAGQAGRWRGFHAARKHSGTRLYHATRDFTRVSLFLGHLSVDTTRRYVAVQEDDVAAEVEEF